jgi:hypothetical protein
MAGRTGACAQAFGSELKNLLFDSNCRQIEMLPASLTQNLAGEIVLVQPLHHCDDCSRTLVVEARDERSAESIDHPLARGFRLRFGGVERIVDDDEVGPAPRQCAADRSGVPASPSVVTNSSPVSSAHRVRGNNAAYHSELATWRN